MIALHQERYPTSSIYNVTDIIRVTGTVEKGTMIDALQMMYAGHPTLAMSLKGNDSAVLANSSTVRSMAEKCIVLHEPVKEEELMAVTSANTKTPFNLSLPHGLGRIHIIPVANTNTTIIQAIAHHLACDGFSGFALATRFIQFCTRDDNFFWHFTHAMRPAAIDGMIHFNAAQTHLVQSNNSMKEFWTAKVSAGEYDSRLDMLTSLPRGSSPTYNGAERIVKLDSAIWERLKNKAGELNCTRFHLLAGAWSIVVSRYSQQTKFNLGTAFHCRKEEWLDATIFASNAMPVRLDVDQQLNVNDFVASIKKSVDARKKSEEFPASALIKSIVDTKRVSTSKGQNPLFQIEVNYYHAPPLPKLPTKDLVMKERIYPHYMQAGMTDLSAWFVTLNNRVILNLKYSTDIYKPELVQQIEADLFNVLSLLANSTPQTKLNEIIRLSWKSVGKLGRGPSRKGNFLRTRLSVQYTDGR